MLVIVFLSNMSISMLTIISPTPCLQSLVYHSYYSRLVNCPLFEGLIGKFSSSYDLKSAFSSSSCVLLLISFLQSNCCLFEGYLLFLWLFFKSSLYPVFCCRKMVFLGVDLFLFLLF